MVFEQKTRHTHIPIITESYQRPAGCILRKNIEKCPSYTDDPRKMGTVFLSTADE